MYRLLNRKIISLLMSLFWTLVATIVFIQATIAMKVRNEPNDWFLTLLVSLGWLYWALASPFIVKVIGGTVLEKDKLLRPLLTYLAWSFVFVSLHIVFEVGLYYATLSESNAIYIPAYVLYNIHNQFLAFFFTVFVVKGIDFYDRYNSSRLQAEKLNTELINARLGALKMQLNPHFLFNTHHSIISLMLKNENKKAIGMLVKLSDFLRATLDNNNQLSRLGDEITLMRFYLDIQQIRFGDKLTVRIDVPAMLEKAAVPTFILQPIIENAIIHGIAPYSQPAALTVTCSRTNDRLEIEVHDDGGGLVPQQLTEGIGLKNTKGRLAEMYREQAGLEIGPHPVKGTVTKIWLPYSEYNLPS